MKISEQDLKILHKQLKTTCGGLWQDYFSLAWLEQVQKVPLEQALDQVAFGNHDYGIDAYHFDEEKRNLYLYQFKWSKEYDSFKESYHRLIDKGITEIFGLGAVQRHRNDLLDHLHNVLRENRNVIDQVYIDFVFAGEPEKAENSNQLQALREKLEEQSHVLDEFFGKKISLSIRYQSSIGRKSNTQVVRTHEHPLSLEGVVEVEASEGQRMRLGVGRLYDLYNMYRLMRRRLFERNIRYGLPEDGAVNRVLMRTFKEIAIDQKKDPSVFVFDHNGVTFSAQQVEQDGEKFKVVEPRLLNGAQTITTLAGFIEKNADRPDIDSIKDRLKKLRVICKMITEAEDDFITRVTINNNRQNPVLPSSLRANDPVQLALADFFVDHLGIFYERQQRSFDDLTEDERNEQGITDAKAIEILKLANTFLASDGDLTIRSMQRIFEEDKSYEQLFNMRRMDVDPSYIVLCYKIQSRLRMLAEAIKDSAVGKYDFVRKGRMLLWALLCQSVLNDKRLDELAEQHGQSLVMSAGYAAHLRKKAISECRILLGDLAGLRENKDKISVGNFDFVRSKHAFEHCMSVAKNRFGWKKVRLIGRAS